MNLMSEMKNIIKINVPYMLTMHPPDLISFAKGTQN